MLQYADTGLVYACTALLRRLTCLLMPCMHCCWNGILSLYKKISTYTSVKGYWRFCRNLQVTDCVNKQQWVYHAEMARLVLLSCFLSFLSQTWWKKWRKEWIKYFEVNAVKVVFFHFFAVERHMLCDWFYCWLVTTTLLNCRSCSH